MEPAISTSRAGIRAFSRDFHAAAVEPLNFIGQAEGASLKRSRQTYSFR